MKYLFLTFILFAFYFTQAQSLKDIESKRIMLPNGWGITPIGTSFHLGDLPLNIAVSSNKKLMAVTNNGQSDQTIYLIDPIKQIILDTILIAKSYIGIAFTSDEKSIYASGGNDNIIIHFDISSLKLIPKDTIVLGVAWPNRICPTGITIDDKRGLLYVATSENNALYVVDINSKKIVKQINLGGEGYTCLLSPNRKMLYITCWGCDRVVLFDTDKQEIAGSIPVGDNPNDMCMSKDGKYLYIANANDNSVSVIATEKRKVIETLNAALFPDAPNGSTTNGVALSEDDKTLYIANADNDYLAVFDVSTVAQSHSRGFIPTGWYPTCVKVIGKTIFVANGKGFSSFANPQGPNPIERKQKVIYQGADKKSKEQYIGGLFHGTMSMIPVPDDAQLAIYSQAVYNNTPYTKDKEMNVEGKVGNPIPIKVGDASPIKYVFYIIKENRTYDQVLSDMPGGNGDTSLLLFGKKVTPNQHALAKEFVLLDNFYVNGEVSADGHNWSMAAYATDFLEKKWPTSYGSRGGDYNAEGGREVANNKNGFIWDLCKKYGVSYRTYGEFADDYKPNIPALIGHFCPYYTSWDEAIRDTTRFSQWKREFDSLVSKNSVPQMNTLRFINDHTEGLSKGRATPAAHVADNDLAVGLFIEHLSHSPIWAESAVFILEDDAQNGPDHVDAHRSPAYIAGPFVKRNFVDHSSYTTSGILRTIELILGLPPMSQYDAAAVPLWKCFTAKTDHTAFKAVPALVDLNEMNLVWNQLSERSAKFDFTKEDLAPDLELNEVIWKGIKGINSVMPAPKRAAFLKVKVKVED